MATTEKTMDELRGDIDKLKSDMARLVETLGDLAGDTKREGLRTLRNAGSRAQARAERSVEAVEEQIVERPLTSVLVAFGAGLLFGKLLDR